MAKSYSEKLKSPKWQKKRLEIFQRDNFTCQLCKSTERTLHVHHKEYEGYKDPWDYGNDKLITYCEDCHNLVEKYKRSDFSVFYFEQTTLDKSRLFVVGLIHENGNKFFHFNKENFTTGRIDDIGLSVEFIKKLNSLI